MDAGGGWIGSAGDLVKLVCAFDRFSTRPDVISTATLDSMTKASVNYANYAHGISVNAYNNWWHMGSLPGTTTEFVRNGNGRLNWALLLNTRDQNGNINAAVDNLVWNVLPTITSWPSNDQFVNTISVSEPNIQPEIRIYPNPAAEWIIIEKPNQIPNGSFRILDAWGKTVEYVGLHETVTDVSVQMLPSGHYTLIPDNAQGEPVRFAVIQP
jgi:hypothetical protein